MSFFVNQIFYTIPFININLELVLKTNKHTNEIQTNDFTVDLEYTEH